MVLYIDRDECDQHANACRESFRPGAEGSSKAKTIVRARLKIVK
jgi:hypothetical protein